MDYYLLYTWNSVEQKIRKSLYISPPSRYGRCRMAALLNDLYETCNNFFVDLFGVDETKTKTKTTPDCFGGNQ